MNRIVFWALVAPCVVAVVWGALNGNQDLVSLGVIAEAIVIGVNYLLIRADEHEGGGV
ncbi:hypothetical protein [Streptomyces sp. NPDC086023]|uniref:hypothetical protein n=1 Tax=Streptomyces sp. NPDC086023 TaxID=3365746 RepID=UPI0037CFBFBA